MSKKIRGFPVPGTQPHLDPISTWKEAHAVQLELCDELEDIADSLPSRINQEQCLTVAQYLATLIRDIHRFEEDALFPGLKNNSYLFNELATTIERLRFEHFTDECYADDLTDRLLYLGSGGTNVNMEATGYMLRGFFEAVRRHIAFERDYFSNMLGSNQKPH